MYIENTTGKKFAPKAARRRPGAAPAAPTPAPAPSASEPAPSTLEAVTSTSETVPSTSDAAPATVDTIHPPSNINLVPPSVQLPTPAATQEPSSQNISPAAVNTVESTASILPTFTKISPTTQPPIEQDVDHDIEEDRATKRRRIDVTAQKSPVVVDGASVVRDAGPVSRSTIESEKHFLSRADVLQISEDSGPATVSLATDTAAEPQVAQSNGENNGSTQTRKRRKLPWTAVNHPQEGDIEDATIVDIGRPPRRRARRNVTTDTSVEGVDLENDDDGVDGPSVTGRARVRARGEQKSSAGDTEADAGAQKASKKAQRPKKAKGAGTDGSNTLEVEGGAGVVVGRKPRQPRRKKATPAQAEGTEGGDGSSQPKRKGRPPREPTPSDAEDETIDPEETYMDSLASHNIRVGRLSKREKEMRKVDWVAVKARRREEDARPIKSKEEQEAADKALAEAGAALGAQQVEMGPRLREVNGRIEMVHDSGTINREADADIEIANYEIVETQDITARITSRSFMKNNKRFPNDFILPGQGKRWNAESTELFYQGLKSFGTDFQMISHMFPGSTRRSIKLKFTREEREYPERVRDALQGRSELLSHWDVFLEASNMKDESFVDADEIKRQLAEDEAEMRERIVAAQLETEERNRQKVAAGVLDETEGGDAANKGVGKGKKKREKGKQVTFQEEEGVEIVGNVDDDDTWGQE